MTGPPSQLLALPPALGMAAVALAAATWWGGLAWLQRTGTLHPETARKLLHVATGLLALSFPWLFADRWPPAVLVGGTLLALAAVRFVPRARRMVGGVLHGVGRASWGEFYLPAAILAVWFLADGDIVLYTVPILIVTFADALAALVGVRYGQHRYAAVEGHKSSEGSLAFLVVSFLCAHVVLLLGSPTGRLESLLVAAILGVLVMLVEAMAWKGLDNLVIPVFGFLLLESLLAEAAANLLFHLAAVAILAGVVLIWREATTLRGGALCAAVLLGYTFWTVGGWEWVVAPFVMFASYSWLPPRSDLDQTRSHDAPVLLAVASAGLFWLLASHLLGMRDLLFPSTVAFAAHLGITSAVRLRYARPTLPDATVAWASTIQGAGLVLIPYAVVMGPAPWTWAQLAVGTAATALAVAGFHIARLPVADPLPAGYRWPRQAWWAAGASALAVAPGWLAGVGHA